MPRFYNSGIKKKKHCYSVLYTFKEDQPYIFLCKKKHFSKHDGYIHNNPGQFVFPGGKSDIGEKYDDAAIREFKEELDVTLDKTDITYQYSQKNFHCIYVYIKNIDDFNKTLGFENIKKHKEITETEWYDYDKAIKIMNRDLSNNLPKINKDVIDEYLEHIKYNEKWKLVDQESELHKYLTFMYGETDWVRNILHDIVQNGKDTVYYQLMTGFLTTVFYKVSSIDWFDEMLYVFSQEFLNN